jgi:hypothetical protein
VAYPAPAPVKIDIYVDSGGVHITFPTASHYRYTVLYTQALAAPSTWTLLGAVDGDGLVHEIVDPSPLHAARFYRLRVDCVDCAVR